jgi:hypothetical protein
MSRKELWLKKLEIWPSGLLVLLEWGSVILFSSVMTNISLAIDNSVKGYISLGLLICIGILIVIFSTVIGVFIYEANRRQITWLWKEVFRKKDEEIRKYLSRPPYGCDFTILIMRVVGIGITVSFPTILILSYFSPYQ